MIPGPAPRLGILALCLGAMAGCQNGLDGASPGEPTEGAVEATSAADEDDDAARLDWASLGDCTAQLARLTEMAQADRLNDRRSLPFGVVVASRSGPQSWLRPRASYVRADLPLRVHDGRERSPLSEPCVIEVGPARDVTAEQQVVRRDEVRSAYQSGTRSEKNPAYDVAQARLRQAEREMKDDSINLLEVGDPLLDLVSMLVGGVLGGFSAYDDGDAFNEALAELAATPRSLDRPVWRDYHFERTTLRAAKSAVIPVVLVDRARGLESRVELRQREYREFEVLEGLDPRDRDYEQHREASISRNELDRWMQRPPELELSSVARALLDASPGDTLVVAGESGAGDVIPTAADPDPDAASSEDASLGTALDRLKGAPPPGHEAALHPVRARPASDGRERRRPPPADTDATDGRLESVVRIGAQGRTGVGFYVGPRHVLTTRRLVEGATLVDVTTADGDTVPALTAAPDGRGEFALVQVPKRGTPVRLRLDARPSGGSPVEVGLRLAGGEGELLAGSIGGDRQSDAVLPGEVGVAVGDRTTGLAGSPVFAGDEVVAMLTGRTGRSDETGVALTTVAIERFLGEAAPGLLAAR